MIYIYILYILLQITNENVYIYYAYYNTHVFFICLGKGFPEVRYCHAGNIGLCVGRLPRVRYCHAGNISLCVGRLPRVRCKQNGLSSTQHAGIFAHVTI